MIYLDKAATSGAKPHTVLTATAAATELCANAGRGAYRLALSCLNGVQACRKALAEHFDCPDPERVIFTKNCTEGLNVLLLGTLKQGDHIVTTCLDRGTYNIFQPLIYGSLQIHNMSILEPLISTSHLLTVTGWISLAGVEIILLRLLA